MRQYITPHRTANKIQQLRTQIQYCKFSFVVVEGSTDVRFFERFIDKSCCEVISAETKDNAIQVLAILESRDVPGILTIVDSDFWFLEQKPLTSPNLLLTDTHDVETMILNSDVFDKFISEFVSRPKIKLFNIQDLVIKAAVEIGYIRWLSLPSQKNLSLKFKGLVFDNFMDSTSLSLNLASLARELRANTRGCLLTDVDIQSFVSTLKSNSHDPWHICCGHDLTQILSFGLRKVFGKRQYKNITAENIEGILRISYETSNFCQTQLYLAIKGWEKKNAPFRVLRP